MPEGPSLVIAREELAPFVGKTIISASGNAKIDFDRLKGRRIKEIRTWGKLLLIVLKDVKVRIHFLMFGAFSINTEKREKRSLRLHLALKKDNIYFYTCSVRFIEDEIFDAYDPEADVMNDEWNPARARKKLRKRRKHLFAMRYSINQYLRASETLLRMKCCTASVCTRKQKSATSLPASLLN